MAPNQADTDSAAGARTPETVDRLMVGICGAIWLVLLAIGVIATVALVQLGRAHVIGGGEDEGSSWLLYSIIVISALVIIGAIPLLMRARRTALTEPTPEVAAPEAPVRPTEAPTEKLRVFGTSVDPYARAAESADAVPQVPVTAVERVWLRGSVSLLSAMGLALIAVATATYLLATEGDTAAWVALGTAAVITVGMPAILIAFQRQLASVIEDPAD